MVKKMTTSAEEHILNLIPVNNNRVQITLENISNPFDTIFIL